LTTFVCFLEELSARVFLEGVLPRLLPNDITIKYVVFDGKQDLEKQLVKKMRNWKTPDSGFLVLRDQDTEDCAALKTKLVRLCMSAGKPEALVRIACRELEGFYFGDLAAVGKALNTPAILPHLHKARYRIPDDIIKPSKELSKLTNQKYQKISGSREIGKIISLKNNTSHSFTVLLSGIKKIAACTADKG
jgi:SpoVK/Ycf46/Vps4 family AAA+-type ATPase